MESKPQSLHGHSQELNGRGQGQCQDVESVQHNDATKAKVLRMKKALRETQTLHTGCSKVEPKNFCPTADPFPGGAGWPKFNQLEMVTTFTYGPSLVKINACNFELSW